MNQTRINALKATVYSLELQIAQLKHIILQAESDLVNEPSVVESPVVVASSTPHSSSSPNQSSNRLSIEEKRARRLRVKRRFEQGLL